MTEKNEQAGLFSALARAQAAAKNVEKDAKNSFHKYNYVSAEAMIAEAKACLSTEGLAVVPTSANLREPRPGEAPTGGDGDLGKGARTVLVASWLVCHSDGGSLPIECEWPVIPEKGRPLDKALAAARTASLNYLLRDLLQLPRVEEGTDLDHDSRDQHRNGHREPPAPAAPTFNMGPVLDVAKAVLEGDDKVMVWALGAIPRATDDSEVGQKMARALTALVEKRSAKLDDVEWLPLDNKPATVEAHKRKQTAAAYLETELAKRGA